MYISDDKKIIAYFQTVLGQLELIIKLIKLSEKFSDWQKPLLDSQEVCKLLNISKRTLLKLRKKKRLSYSIDKYKCYYKYSDIEIYLNNLPRQSKIN